ncbi:hypothetical protein M7I_6001 [Glarea lozoyensis 74030]|uniref:Uncharacterized protein n=1 Tax=Glarea lozoyensis (strain ATCC 74030 / MF5533) TaxID=1104152 RepID=H0ETD9_GLAL7|nr:hypothetical protein M7I_6001 [Glarea lozoyensis 74030]
MGYFVDGGECCGDIDVLHVWIKGFGFAVELNFVATDSTNEAHLVLGSCRVRDHGAVEEAEKGEGDEEKIHLLDCFEY